MSVAGLHRGREQLARALAFPLTTWRRALATTLVALGTFVLLVLSTFPEMAWEMLAADPGYVDEALLLLLENLYETTGTVGVLLVFVYAVLTGVTVLDVVTQVRVAGVRSAAGLGSLAPGLLASGCASCGAGVLGLLGFAGAMAALPFEGNLLRVGGIALLVWALARTGNPLQCEFR